MIEGLHSAAMPEKLGSANENHTQTNGRKSLMLGVSCVRHPKRSKYVVRSHEKVPSRTGLRLFETVSNLLVRRSTIETELFRSFSSCSIPCVKVDRERGSLLQCALRNISRISAGLRPLVCRQHLTYHTLKHTSSSTMTMSCEM